MKPFVNRDAQGRDCRKAWLMDRISQMGHDPELYERWHDELEAIRQQESSEPYLGAAVDRTPKHVWTSTDKMLGRKLEAASDGLLAHAANLIKRERKRRETARKEQIYQQADELTAEFKAKGYQLLGRAIADVKRVIRDHKIFPELVHGPEPKAIKQMVDGKYARHPHRMPPMRHGCVKMQAREGVRTLVEPKALLCFVINCLQDEAKFAQEQKRRAEEHAAQLKEWEIKQKERAAESAKNWSQWMKEKNATLEQALKNNPTSMVMLPKEQLSQQARRAVAASTKNWLDQQHDITRRNVPRDKPDQSPA